MLEKHRTWWLIGSIVILALVVAGCATRTPESDTLSSPLAHTVAQSVLPSPTVGPTSPPTVAAPSATPTLEPTALPTVVLPSLPLLILHTNDNWGETEPCG